MPTPKRPRAGLLGPLAAFLGLLLAGCAADTGPTLPVDIATLAVGDSPQDIQAGPAPGSVLVSCENAGAVYVLDSRQRTVAQILKLNQGPGPVVPDPAAGCAYVFHLSIKAITTLGGTPLRVLRAFGTGGFSPAGGAVRPGMRELWVCDGVSAVRVLTLPGLQHKARIHLGRYPQGIAFSRDGNLAFVTLKGENAVAVVNAERQEIVKRVTVGIYPQDILLAGNTACVSNYGSGDVSLLDTGKFEERIRLRVRRKPNRLAVHGNTLWVSCEQSYRLVAVDIAQGRVIGSIRAGFYPGAVHALADGSLVVAQPRGDRVAFVSLLPGETSR